METLITFLESIGIFIVGLLIRLLVFIAVVAVVAVPILFVFGGIEGLARLRRWMLGVKRVGAMSWRAGVYYAPGHTWVEPSTGRGVRVGIDDLAQRLLPGMPHVTLPRVGSPVRQGDPVAMIRVDGHEAQVLSPVTGTVTAVNGHVRRDPSLLQRDPYVRGWLI
ncbi:MAG: glycine cleavage system protein H [Acidobacteria bacterium]|nr:glycine cleavage system protein H [Acidobacteriota bacterium]